jgi:hypothetical protein
MRVSGARCPAAAQRPPPNGAIPMAQAKGRNNTHPHTHTHTQREREREREGEREREREREACLLAVLSCLIHAASKLGERSALGGGPALPHHPNICSEEPWRAPVSGLASPEFGSIFGVRLDLVENRTRVMLAVLIALHRGDNIWYALMAGGGQCLRRSHPSDPTRAPPRAIQGCQQHCFSTDALGIAITHRVPFLQRRRHRHR